MEACGENPACRCRVISGHWDKLQHYYSYSINPVLPATSGRRLSPWRKVLQCLIFQSTQRSEVRSFVLVESLCCSRTLQWVLRVCVCQYIISFHHSNKTKESLLLFPNKLLQHKAWLWRISGNKKAKFDLLSSLPPSSSASLSLCKWFPKKK